MYFTTVKLLQDLEFEIDNERDILVSKIRMQGCLFLDSK